MMINNRLSINERILHWDSVRGLLDNGFNVELEADNLAEEVQELRDSKTWDDKVDALCDVIKFAKGGLLKLGCDIDLALDQMLLEIESRMQCPVQKKKWEEQGNDGEKWQKDRNQHFYTLYRADYSKAKID